MGQKFHGRAFTALLVGVAQGQEGRIFGEIPAHEAVAVKDGRKGFSKTFNAYPPESVNLLTKFCATLRAVNRIQGRS
jgi:hypothetical protein